MSTYFAVIDGQVEGPMERAALDNLVIARRVGSNSLVSRSENPEGWLYYGELSNAIPAGPVGSATAAPPQQARSASVQASLLNPVAVLIVIAVLLGIGLVLYAGDLRHRSALEDQAKTRAAIAADVEAISAQTDAQVAAEKDARDELNRVQQIASDHLAASGWDAEYGRDEVEVQKAQKHLDEVERRAQVSAGQ